MTPSACEPVALTDRLAAADQSAAIATLAGGRACAVTVDITDPDSVVAMATKVVERYGRIDILINNAAMTVRQGSESGSGYFAPFETYPLDLWEQALHINLTGLFLCTQAVGRVMVRQRRGVILNVASDLSVISPDHRIYEDEKFNTPISYSVSKTAVLGFTRYLATYWAQHNIRVNAISPAGVFDGHKPTFVRKLSSLIPLGRMAAKDEYRGAVVFLVSDASSFMTGANLVVDGGRSAW
ncbi:MAG: SDR family oxidoreductase [Candidatus Rokubacteria bacterium]|nr:SDR family oxidoreductase [Candidatus Rokubacteria bacterium]